MAVRIVIGSWWIIWLYYSIPNALFNTHSILIGIYFRLIIAMEPGAVQHGADIKKSGERVSLWDHYCSLGFYELPGIRFLPIVHLLFVRLSALSIVVWIFFGKWILEGKKVLRRSRTFRWIEYSDDLCCKSISWPFYTFYAVNRNVWGGFSFSHSSKAPGPLWHLLHMAFYFLFLTSNGAICFSHVSAALKVIAFEVRLGTENKTVVPFYLATCNLLLTVYRAIHSSNFSNTYP